MRKLDRTRHFGEIFGAADNARYEQFGIKFDSAGNELPGYEDVTIPEQREVVIVQGDDTALRAEIARLNELLSHANTQLEDADAAREEVQGKLDSANIEIARMSAEISRLNSLIPGDDLSDASLNAQLDLQTAGMAGKKK